MSFHGGVAMGPNGHDSHPSFPFLQIPFIALLLFPITHITTTYRIPPMSAPMSNNFCLLVEVETKFTQKPGIFSIIESDKSERNKFSSLRRTLSADMSSKKWLDQNGMKKIASSQEISGQFDLWTSIACQNASEKISSSFLAPYIHPLVKSKSNSLNQKSLEICTENLGSETGSDGFSSDLLSENGETEEDRRKEQEHNHVSFSLGKKSPSPPRSFPPPLASLSRHDGGTLQMQSHRDNGRLIVEAVSIPSKTNFRAQRQDGRLVLTFVRSVSEDEESKNDATEEEFPKEGSKQMEPKLSINVHRLALMVNKPMELNPTWVNRSVKSTVDDDKLAAAQSLPPRPRLARPLHAPAADSVNVYEYFWRTTQKTKHLHNNGNKLIISKNPIANEEKTLLMLRGCKEAKRSFSFWEPYCIAT